MSISAIELSRIEKRFGALTALNGVTLSVAPGERLALLGHNGAGKTTLIRLVLGLIRPDGGTLRVLDGAAGSMAARRRIAYLPENVAFHGALTGREQLALFARMRGRRATIVPGLLDRVGLGEALDRRISTWSKGMRQRLGLAQILIGEPDLVVLDEPTSGLDPISRGMFYDIVAELAGRGAAVLLSSHALTEMEARADRIVILKKGDIVADGRLAELRAGAALPIRLRVSVKPDEADRVAETVGGLRINGCAVEISCSADDKLRHLAAVTALGPAVEDIEIVPPSLEDLYRHFNQSRPSAGDQP